MYFFNCFVVWQAGENAPDNQDQGEGPGSSNNNDPSDAKRFLNNLVLCFKNVFFSPIVFLHTPTYICLYILKCLFYMSYLCVCVYACLYKLIWCALLKQWHLLWCFAVMRRKFNTVGLQKMLVMYSSAIFGFNLV